MAKMSSRERVLTAIGHHEPDRVPNCLGASGSTSLHLILYERLKKFLNISSPSRLLSQTMRYSRLDREILEHFGCDVCPVYAKGIKSDVSGQISEQTYMDEWGVTWQLEPGGLYFSPVTSKMPLRTAEIDDLKQFSWPQTAHPSRFAGLRDECRDIRRNTDFAISASAGTCLCEHIYNMRGLDNFLADLLINQEFALVLLKKITDLMIEAIEACLAEIGEYVDIFIMGDDLGSQHAPLLSPDLYRSMIKPFHAQIIEAVKTGSNAKVFFHSCGDIYPLLKDFIEIGVDILNPVQVSAEEMSDTKRLKAEFGKALTFCGGIDSQHVLPFGSPKEVRCEVRRRIADLAPGGGYLCAAVHCIQPDVPIDNVLTYLDELRISGAYPLSV